ncbi:VanW family protein [Kroppenstedtia eburnea]|uniref:Vancomycin resistance protein YoaR, contains peptidoglycan-binding and VanW domains n=1 Tax=Kroppenstedtia eburnea TaxID=714067 RepID=A0A1N7JK53_9BACL|nr:VanW family protein [Kroppenstedtia eburnea]QKI83551.1 DnaJ domain-containing protein [Kroppenstedtia eburnea]SIS49626.1 Vancomycin resistance protein YoaR, contains peptidoglycan-binding and VanW domains [Kroppenstedtia eburnea]
MKDNYSVLGVNPEATPQEIKQAYRRLIRKYHPDVNPSPDAEARFREVREAYEALRRQRFPAPSPPAVEDFGEAEGEVGEEVEDVQGPPCSHRESEASDVGSDPEDIGPEPEPLKKGFVQRWGWFLLGLPLLLIIAFLACTWFPGGLMEKNRLILQEGDRQWSIDLNDLGFDGKDPETIDSKKLDAWLNQIRKEVDQPPQNARVQRLGEPIRPAREGWIMDKSAIHRNLSTLPKILNTPQPVPMKKAKPLVTAKDLRQVDRKLIGSYTTYFNKENQARVHNIRLSAKLLDRKVLNPGEVFSFNQTVGERSRERGFLPVKSRVSGEFSEGVGGGVSQISSTLFNSVDAAGMEIIYRFSYARQDTYVPSGRDATVSWDQPDFRFLNNLKEPILIRTALDEHSVTVRIFSTPDVKVMERTIPQPPRVLPQDVPTQPDEPSDKLDPKQVKEGTPNREVDPSDQRVPTTGGTKGTSTGGGDGSTGDGDALTTGGDTEGGTGPGGGEGEVNGRDPGEQPGEHPGESGGDTGTSGGDPGDASSTAGGADSSASSGSVTGGPELPDPV